MPFIDIPAEFVLAATKTLHERVPGGSGGGVVGQRRDQFRADIAPGEDRPLSGVPEVL